MRVFLDANVIFSAAKSAGAIRQLLALVEQSGHRCCVNAYVVEEARRNLTLKAPEQLPTLESMLSRMMIAAATGASGERMPTRSIALHPKDRPVLDAAIQSGCDALLTGDRTHFGALYARTIGGVSIHSPRSLAEVLLRG